MVEIQHFNINFVFLSIFNFKTILVLRHIFVFKPLYTFRGTRNVYTIHLLRYKSNATSRQIFQAPLPIRMKSSSCIKVFRCQATLGQNLSMFFQRYLNCGYRVYGKYRTPTKSNEFCSRPVDDWQSQCCSVGNNAVCSEESQCTDRYPRRFLGQHTNSGV